MKKYELFLVLPGTLDEQEAAARAQEILGLIKENAAEAELESLGKSRLSYPIRQIRYGYFYLIVFSAEAEGLKTLQSKLGLQRDLLRGIISKFAAKAHANKRISYSVSDSGVAMMEEVESAPAGEKTVKKPEAKKVNLEDINKKLDEILGGEIMPEV